MPHILKHFLVMTCDNWWTEMKQAVRNNSTQIYPLHAMLDFYDTLFNDL